MGNSKSKNIQIDTPRTTTGKEYTSNGDRFEGEFIDGIANGKGIMYYVDGEIFECEYKDGVANGKGFKYFPNGERFECDYKDGQANGTGMKYYPLGYTFECDYKGGKINGNCIICANSGRFHFQFENGIVTGNDIQNFISRDKFEDEEIIRDGDKRLRRWNYQKPTRLANLIVQ